MGVEPVVVNGIDTHMNDLAEEDGEGERDEDEEDKFDIDDSSPEASAAKELDIPDQPSSLNEGFEKSLGAEHPPVSKTSAKKETDSPDSTRVAHPLPLSIPPQHLISTAAERIQNLRVPPVSRLPHVGSSTIASPSSPEALQPTPSAPRPRSEERDGDRDNIRAPESLFQSNKSKIPRDRDIEAESMRTPRPDIIQSVDKDDSEFTPTATNRAHAGGSLPLSSSPNSRMRSHTHTHPQHLHPVRPTARATPAYPRASGHGNGDGGPGTVHHRHTASTSTPAVPGPTRPHLRNHRRHASVDSIGAPRRAFAAWGLDESDSNASDSDA